MMFEENPFSLRSIILSSCYEQYLREVRQRISDDKHSGRLRRAYLSLYPAIFTWDAAKTSNKIKLDPECLKAKSTEGNGFKTTMGTEIFSEGGRYYFEIFINKGQLIKIGVCRPTITNLE